MRRPFHQGRDQVAFCGFTFGPRCIPAFGVWQKGKLRRIDTAAISGHYDLTFTCETIVCDPADLPAMIAPEFGKYVDFGSVQLGIGTDDFAAAYDHRVCIPTAEPEYTIAAVWKPAAGGEEGGVFILP